MYVTFFSGARRTVTHMNKISQWRPLLPTLVFVKVLSISTGIWRHLPAWGPLDFVYLVSHIASPLVFARLRINEIRILEGETDIRGCSNDLIMRWS